MYQSKWRNTLNDHGFTFIEALFQLVVFMLFAQFIAYFFIWNSQFDETFFTTDELDWEMFVHDFEKYFINVTELTVEEQKIVVQQVGEEKTIVINKISDIIRMQRDDKGNVPLLIGISDVKFRYNGNKLTMTVEWLSGQKRERTIVVKFSKE